MQNLSLLQSETDDHVQKKGLLLKPVNHDVFLDVYGCEVSAHGSKCDKLLLAIYIKKKFMPTFGMLSSAILKVRTSRTRGTAPWFVIIVFTDYTSLSVRHWSLSIFPHLMIFASLSSEMMITNGV